MRIIWFLGYLEKMNRSVIVYSIVLDAEKKKFRSMYERKNKVREKTKM